MKRKASLFLLFLLALSLFLRLYIRDDYMGFRKNDFTVVSETDSHGGFLGDGSYCLILDCSESPEKAASLLRDWQPLPLPETLQLIMYGSERDGIHYGYNLAEEHGIPPVSNGCYRFRDRSSQSTDPADPSELFNRYSFNFSLGLYDADTDIMYYFEFDT